MTSRRAARTVTSYGSAGRMLAAGTYSGGGPADSCRVSCLQRGRAALCLAMYKPDDDLVVHVAIAFRHEPRPIAKTGRPAALRHVTGQ
jgi:hypothetical protein